MTRGFSYIFLFMMSIFNFVWTCIIVGMWLDTVYNSRMYKSGRRPGLLRSILDIAEAIKQEIGDHDTAEEEELKRMLNVSGGALIVPKGELRIARVDSEEIGLKKRGWRRRLTKGSTF